MTGPVYIQPKPVPPMSNIERQRRFRERNPGYYGRLHRKRKAATKAMMPQYMAMIHAQVQARLAAENRAPLMLPAPTIDPLTSEIAALAESLKKASSEVCEIGVKNATPDVAAEAARHV